MMMPQRGLVRFSWPAVSNMMIVPHVYRRPVRNAARIWSCWPVTSARTQTRSNQMPSLNGHHASRCLPAFLAAAHLFFIASASLFRPSSLSLPRRERDGDAALFGTIPVPPVFLAAQRLFVASMILLRPSGLRADAIIDSHRSNRIVPGWQSRMSFDAETADLLC